jgi:hypothetical protein
MIKNMILVLIALVLFISCNDPIKEVVLYQNTGEIDRTYDVTEDTFWDFKKDGDIDSLTIKSTVDFNSLYSKLLKKPYKEKPFLNPEYAIIIKTSKKTDTIYLNDKLDKGYSIEQLIMFEDVNDKILLTYFREKQFLTQHTESILNN